MKKVFKKNEINAIAKDILAIVCDSNIIALSGDLGAGKTTLTQEIARELGVKENVISPTFVIMKTYELNAKNFPKEMRGNFSHLIHIDAYRLNSHKELLTLGWQETISNPKNLILIEWPERVEEIIPKNSHKIYLSHKNEEEREISF